MSESIEFIPKAGACLATLNVLEGRGKVRWMVRRPSQAPADNGWQVMSHIDESDYLNDTSNWRIVDFNELCAIEPALIGIWDLPVGSDLQLVRDETGLHIVDTPTGREIPREELFVPPQFRGPPPPHSDTRTRCGFGFEMTQGLKGSLISAKIGVNGAGLNGIQVIPVRAFGIWGMFVGQGIRICTIGTCVGILLRSNSLRGTTGFATTALRTPAGIVPMWTSRYWVVSEAA